MKKISIGYPMEYEDDKGVIRTGLWLKEKEVEQLEEILKYVKEGKMIVENISLERHLQPRYLTDDLKETERKNKLDYYEYNITIRDVRK